MANTPAVTGFRFSRVALAGWLALTFVHLTSAEIYRMQELDKLPHAKSTPRAPVYPYELRKEGVQGMAVVRSYVNSEGIVERSEVVGQTHLGFGKSAYESVSRLTYEPPTKNANAAEFVVQVPVTFSLGDDDVENLEPGIFGFPTKASDKLPPEYHYDRPPYPADNPRPVYPYDQWVNKVAGTAQVTYAVDETGKVVEVTLGESSDPAFGYALAAALQNWYFKPAKLNGKPSKAVANLTANFDLYQPPTDGDIRLRDLIRKKTKFADAKELDAELNLEHQVSPKYPIALASDGHAGEAVIEFYIDRDGWVRLPKIVSATKPEFGWSAATAVSLWKFTPPRKGGKPVDVRIRAPFDFAALRH